MFGRSSNAKEIEALSNELHTVVATVERCIRSLDELTELMNILIERFPEEQPEPDLEIPKEL